MSVQGHRRFDDLQNFDIGKGATVLLDVARSAYLDAESDTELEVVIRDIDLMLPVVESVYQRSVALKRHESASRPDTELAKTFLRTLRAFASSRLGLPVPNLMQLLGLEVVGTDLALGDHAVFPDSKAVQRDTDELIRAIEQQGILTRKNQAMLRGSDRDGESDQHLGGY